MAVWSRKLRTSFGLTLQDLFDQVIHDIAVVSGERPDKLGNVIAPAHRERRQLEPGDPAFGAVLQRGDVAQAERLRPITWLRNAAASAGVKRRSAARSSVIWPRARNRARGSCGSSRVVITRCICGGRCSSRKARAPSTQCGVDHVVVVKDQDEMIGDGGDLIKQRGQQCFSWRWRGLERAATPAPIVGAIVCNEATRYARKRVGSLSPSSSDSQATLKR